MIRLALLLFLVGIYLICSGCYDLFIQAGTSRQPTTVTVAELEKAVPANRHLVVTGGRPVAAAAVKFYKTKWGTKISGSEILFIPIVNASTATSDTVTPSILLRVTEDQVDAAKAGQKISFGSIEGVRTTSMDLEDKARQRLVDTYGEAAVDKMVILAYHGDVGMGGGMGNWQAAWLSLVAWLPPSFLLENRSSRHLQSPPRCRRFLLDKTYPPLPHS
jgi:hypothetical protein